VPTEAEIRAFYHAVWKARRASDVVLIKTLLYTGVRVAELVRIRIADVDLDACRIRITQGNGGKDRVVPFPPAFKETLALHIDAQRRAGAAHLFESSWKNAGRRHRLVRHGWPQWPGRHPPAGAAADAAAVGAAEKRRPQFPACAGAGGARLRCPGERNAASR